MKKLLVFSLVCIFMASSISIGFTRGGNQQEEQQRQQYQQRQQPQQHQQQRQQQNVQNHQRQQQNVQNHQRQQQNVQQHQRQQPQYQQHQRQQPQQHVNQQQHRQYQPPRVHQQYQHRNFQPQYNQGHRNWRNHFREIYPQEFLAGIVGIAILGAIEQSQLSDQDFKIDLQFRCPEGMVTELTLEEGDFADVEYADGSFERVYGPSTTGNVVAVTSYN